MVNTVTRLLHIRKRVCLLLLQPPIRTADSEKNKHGLKGLIRFRSDTLQSSRSGLAPARDTMTAMGQDALSAHPVFSFCIYFASLDCECCLGGNHGITYFFVLLAGTAPVFVRSTRSLALYHNDPGLLWECPLCR